MYGVVDPSHLQDYMEVLSGSRYNINSHCMQGNAETMAANRLSYFFNLEGPSVTYNTACSSSLVAVHSAVRALQNHECRWAIAGGANALLDPRYFVGRFGRPLSSRIHRLGHHVSRWPLRLLRL